MPPLARVTTATEADLATIADMRRELGWHPNRWLLNALHTWSAGQLFVIRGSLDEGAARESGSSPHDILAAAAAAAYGLRGFVGNVMVHASVRRQGLGRALMIEALNWLRTREASVVELDATPEGRPLYERLGFRGMQPSWFMRTHIGQRQRRTLAQLGAAVAIDTRGFGSLGEIERLDRMAFGADRLGLLQHILAGGDCRLHLAHDESEEVVGYLVARQLSGGDTTVRVGPWVATSPSVAAALLPHALGVAEAEAWIRHGDAASVVACIEGTNHRALELARTCGLHVVEDDLRMWLSLANGNGGDRFDGVEPAALGRPEWVYAMTAPMVG
jgi:GNAT superfamily N-acetyltransferase